MNSDSKNDPILDMVRLLPWHEKPVPNRTTSVVNLGVPAINLTFAPLSKDPKLRDQSLEDLKQVFSAGTVEELTKYEDQVFARLAEEPSRAAQLLTDPVNALRDMGVKLSPPALSELQTVRRKLITPQALQALTAIKHLSIKVEPNTGGE